MKTVAIIQARMGSSRLPGKVLLPLAGMCSLDWCIARVLQADCVDEVCVATTTNPTDRAIDYHMEKWKGNPKVVMTRGSENYVLGRTLNAARERGADVIVDVTSDCPMVDPEHIDFLHRNLLTLDMDYASNVATRSWPDGLDIQIYTRYALEILVRFDLHNLNGEHSGWNFTQNKDAFRIFNWKAHEGMNHPDWRWTLDLPTDWQRLEWLISEMIKLRGNFYSADQVPRVLGLDDLDPNLLKEMMGC